MGAAALSELSPREGNRPGRQGPQLDQPKYLAQDVPADRIQIRSSGADLGGARPDPTRRPPHPQARRTLPVSPDRADGRKKRI